MIRLVVTRIACPGGPVENMPGVGKLEAKRTERGMQLAVAVGRTHAVCQNSAITKGEGEERVAGKL